MKHNSGNEPDLLFGIHPVLEMLSSNPGRLHRIYLVKGRRDARFTAIRVEARRHRIPVTSRSKEELDRLVPGRPHQGVVARLVGIGYESLDDVLRQIADSGRLPLLLVLDQIQDPHNLGAIARTAESVGADALIVPARGSAPPGGVAHKASAGALGRLVLCRVSNVAQTLGMLKEAGYWVLGTAVSGGTPPWELDLAVPLAVVIGGEEKGIRPRVRSQCDMMASIPLSGETESLNASVAAGMLLYEIVRQRR